MTVASISQNWHFKHENRSSFYFIRKPYDILLYDNATCITVTAKLEYNEHGYNKLTAAAIMNNYSCPDKVLIYISLQKIAAYNEHGYNEFTAITK